MIRRAPLPALLLVCLAACGGSTAEGPPASSHSVALPTLAAPALALPEGARWLLLTEPSRVLASPALRRAFDVLVPERRRLAWAKRFALDPTNVAQLSVAEYADGVLLVARGALNAPQVVTATEAAMDAVETSSQPPRPRVVGLIGSDRYLLAAAAEDTLVLGQGAPNNWHGLMRFLDGVSPTPPGSPALHQARLHQATEAEDAPFVLHLLQPLALPLDTAVGVVLAGQQQLSLALSSTDPASIDVWLAMSGEFPETIEDNLRALAASLAAEPLGAALGLTAALSTLRIERDAGVIVLRLQLPTERVIQGLETLFGAELWHLLQADDGVESD